MKRKGQVNLTADSTLKRLAWAYGTAKKDSPEEQTFLDLLLTKAQRMLKEPEPITFEFLGEVYRKMNGG